MKRSRLEKLMASQMHGASLPEWAEEWPVIRGRDWRFDFAWPAVLVALEVEGAVFADGRHTRGKGFEDDCEKYNAATVIGWKVLRCTSNHVHNGAALVWVSSLLQALRVAQERPIGIEVEP